MMKIRVLLITLLSIAVLLSGVRYAVAAPTPVEPNGNASKTYGGRSLQDNLADEGLSTTKEVVSEQEVELDGNSASLTDPFAYQLDLHSGADGVVGTFHAQDEIEGQMVSSTYQVKVAEASPERILFTITNTETGESYDYDSTRLQPSIAFAIPIGIAAISVSTLLYYLSIGAAIIVLGYIALEASRAVPKIMDEWNRQREWSYYVAVRADSKLFIGGHLTNGQAQARGRTGGDVWAVSAGNAKSLAKTLNPSGVPVAHAPHGDGYLYHFHPYRHTPNMHSFYGS